MLAMFETNIEGEIGEKGDENSTHGEKDKHPELMWIRDANTDAVVNKIE